MSALQQAIRLFILALLFAMSGFATVRAADMEGLVQGLAAEGFTAKLQAVQDLAATGDPAAVPVLEALMDGRLYTRKDDGTVFIGRASGQVIVLNDPLTLAEKVQVASDAVDRIAINNRLRSAIRAALGGLTLLSSNPAARRQAAAAVLKGRPEGVEPILKTALARETDPEIRKTMEWALAAVQLGTTSDQYTRIQALDRLSTAADPEVRALVASVLAAEPNGVPIEENESVRAAAKRALMRIEGQLALWDVLVKVFHGISLGSVLLLAAVGLAITFGVMGVINMAHGEMQLVRTIFGPTNQEVGNPSWMSGAIELTGGLTLTYNRMWIIIFSFVVLALLMLLTSRTPFGLRMRAVVQNRRMAASMGIRTGRIDALTFGLGSGIAGIAGVALSQIDNVSPNLGQAYIIDSFMVVVFGGVGNLWGTLVGAMSPGLINKFLEPYAGAILGKIFVLVGIILFIQRRPRGLFALKGRAAEA